MEKIDITRILSSTKYKFPVNKDDRFIYLVDVDTAADKILELIENDNRKKEVPKSPW